MSHGLQSPLSTQKGADHLACMVLAPVLAKSLLNKSSISVASAAAGHGNAHVLNPGGASKLSGYDGRRLQDAFIVIFLTVDTDKGWRR